MKNQKIREQITPKGDGNSVSVLLKAFFKLLENR